MESKSEVETDWRWKAGDVVLWKQFGRTRWEIEEVHPETHTVHLWNPRTDSRVMHARMDELRFRQRLSSIPGGYWHDN